MRDAKTRVAAHKGGDVHAFASAKATVLLGFFAVLHLLVYSVVPSELEDSKEWSGALSSAKRLLREFDDDILAAIDFLRWTWNRESLRLKKGATSDWRIAWRWQFSSRSLLTDYRVSVARQIRRPAAS